MPGIQPLDKILRDLNLSNNDLVRASTAQLTHKVVQKGRKGKRLTVNAQIKILNALNDLSGDRRFTREEIFGDQPQ